MPGKARKANDVHTIYCDVELSRQLSDQAASTVAQELCKYILFMRNQIPMLYEELKSKAEDASAAANIRRRSGRQRKAEKFVAAADQLLSSLSPELFAAPPHQEVVFLLGPSPLRAQEVYRMTCITGSSASQASEISSEQFSASYAAAAAKTVLRKLVMATASAPEGPASKGATKLFVLVKRPADAECPSGFLPKRGVQIRIRKGLQVNVNVRGAEQCSVETGQSPPRMSEGQVSEMSWSQAGAQHTDKGSSLLLQSLGLRRLMQLSPEHPVMSDLARQGLTPVARASLAGGGLFPDALQEAAARSRILVVGKMPTPRGAPTSKAAYRSSSLNAGRSTSGIRAWSA